MMRMLAGSRESGAGSREREAGISGCVVLLALCCTTLGAVQHDSHQAPSTPRLQGDAAQGVEPIRCWRQSSAGAVVVGETFTVTLTCAVFESADAQVVPDESRLHVAAIQMAPFEILGGSHPPDVRRGVRRFLQYDYQLRVIGRDAIGQDVNVPALTVSYRVHSRVGAAATLEGRDLSYLLPAMPIRVLSLVPADAGDIRDASDASLATVDALRSRSRLFQVLSYGLGALALVTAVLALAPLARTRVKTSAGPGVLPDRAILKRAAETLAEVQSRAKREGWTDQHVADALAATRVVASTAIGGPLSQKPVARGAAAPEGRILVSFGAVRPVVSAVSSSTTPDDVGRATSHHVDAISPLQGHRLEGLQSGLSLLTAALYRQSPSRDHAAMDEAVRHAIEAARSIAAERNWWRGLRRAVGSEVTRWARR